MSGNNLILEDDQNAGKQNIKEHHQSSLETMT
jgi:hypothetical protein